MPPKSKKSHRPHRGHHALQKTEILINVYDLLPPSRWSTMLWHMGTSLLHSGVVVNGKEYAYGGHDRPGVTGVYWTQPRNEPPGGTFRCEILQGFTLASPDEIDAIIRAASDEFHGTAYNLLTKNCNHFTAYLCRKLTGRPGPAWLNRAASIGVALPCVVPREWIDPPESDADGSALLRAGDGIYHDGDDGSGGDNANNDDNNDDSDDTNRLSQSEQSERTSMLGRSSSQRSQHTLHMHLVGEDDNVGRSSLSSTRRSGEHHPEPFDQGDEEAGHASAKGKGSTVRDAAGHALPPSEQVPM